MRKTYLIVIIQFHRVILQISLISFTIQLFQRSFALLVPLLPRHPKLLPVLHNIRQNSTTEEHHVFPTWRVLDFDLEFLEAAISIR